MLYSEEQPEASELSVPRKVTIGVAGVMGRIGCTTQAIQLALYLFYQGKNAAYVEMNQTGFLKYLEETYEDVQKDANGNLIYERMTFVKKENLQSVLGSDYEYLVFDYGSVTQQDFQKLSYMERNIQVMVAGSKPEELLRTTEVLCDPDCSRCRFIFSFVPRGDTGAVLDLMTDRKKDTYFAGYIPDLFQSRKEMDVIYAQIVPGEEKNGKSL